MVTPRLVHRTFWHFDFLHADIYKIWIFFTIFHLLYVNFTLRISTLILKFLLYSLGIGNFGWKKNEFLFSSCGPHSLLYICDSGRSSDLTRTDTSRTASLNSARRLASLTPLIQIGMWHLALALRAAGPWIRCESWPRALIEYVHITRGGWIPRQGQPSLSEAVLI